MRGRTPKKSKLADDGSKTEIAVVKPKVIVALGATAAQTLLGKQFRVTRERGKFIKTAIATTSPATAGPTVTLKLCSIIA
jgi:DNA polymerase